MDGRPTSDGLVEPTTQFRESLPGPSIVRHNLHGLLKLFERFEPIPPRHVDPAAIQIGEVAWLIAWSLLGLLQPGEGLIKQPLLHEIDPDIVVRITEIRVDLNGPLAFLNGLVQSFLETVCPA